MDQHNYLKDLSLIDGDAFESFEDINSLESGAENPSFLNFKSLFSFSSEVNESDKSDIMDCLLLAQRAASKAHSDESEGLLWYKKYFEVLENIGWLINSREFNTLETKSDKLEIESAIIPFVTGLLTGPQVKILLKSLKLIKSLGKEDKRLVAFERNSHTHNRGNFQLGMADSEDGIVSVMGSGFVLESEKMINKILFVSLDKNLVKVKFNLYKAQFVSSTYAPLRELVKTKLGDTNNFIATLDI